MVAIFSLEQKLLNEYEVLTIAPQEYGLKAVMSFELDVNKNDNIKIATPKITSMIPRTNVALAWPCVMTRTIFVLFFSFNRYYQISSVC